MSDDRFQRDPDDPEPPAPAYRRRRERRQQSRGFRLTEPQPRGRVRAEDYDEFLRQWEAEFGKPGEENQ